VSLQKATPPILLFRKIKGYPDVIASSANVRSSRVLNDARHGTRAELSQAPAQAVRTDSIELVDDGPVFENVLMDNQVDILAFPAPKWHGNDGGQYIGTECMVIAKDSDSGWVNPAPIGFRCVTRRRSAYYRAGQAMST